MGSSKCFGLLVRGLDTEIIENLKQSFSGKRDEDELYGVLAQYKKWPFLLFLFTVISS